MGKIYILGAGGFAREVESWIEDNGDEVTGFIDTTSSKIYELNEKIVISTPPKDALLVLGVGDPSLKKQFLETYNNKFLTVIHKSVVIGKRVEIGEGCVICPNTILTCDIRLGTGVLLNLGVTVGHDCVIESCTTVSPGANISGNCNIGRRCYIGTNSTLREKINIPDDTTIGMGAVVTKSIEKQGIYVGNPARIK